MFAAHDQVNDRKITAIAPEWAEPAAMETLRRWCREDRIVCPWCDAPVLIRAGEIKARHFAHKKLAECPYANEDAEKLRGRQILYEWLSSKVERTTVELEAKVDGLDLPVPLDLLAVHADRRYGYCFLHRSIRDTGKRDELTEAVAQAGREGLHLHVVFSARLLDSASTDRGWIRLSPTQRRLAGKSDYNKPHGGGRVLHFLDTETRVLTSLRGLSLFEWPQTFQVGKRLTNPMAEVCVRPSNGEMVHPGEYERLKAWEAERAERQRQRQSLEADRARRDLQRRQAQHKHPPERPEDAAPEPWLHPVIPQRAGGQEQEGSLSAPPEFTVAPPSAEPDWPKRDRTAPCGLCGRMTPEEDQIVFDGRTKTCKCRACMRAMEKPSTSGK